MSQIMGLIQSKLCTELGEGKKAAFDSSQLFADALNARLSHHYEHQSSNLENINTIQSIQL